MFKLVTVTALFCLMAVLAWSTFMGARAHGELRDGHSVDFPELEESPLSGTLPSLGSPILVESGRIKPVNPVDTESSTVEGRVRTGSLAELSELMLTVDTEAEVGRMVDIFDASEFLLSRASQEQVSKYEMLMDEFYIVAHDYAESLHRAKTRALELGHYNYGDGVVSAPNQEESAIVCLVAVRGFTLALTVESDFHPDFVQHNSVLFGVGARINALKDAMEK